VPYPAASAHRTVCAIPYAVKHEISTGHLAELETAGWKDDRRFRLLAADRGTLSFSDLYFNTPTKVRSAPCPLNVLQLRLPSLHAS